MTPIFFFDELSVQSNAYYKTMQSLSLPSEFQTLVLDKSYRVTLQFLSYLCMWMNQLHASQLFQWCKIFFSSPQFKELTRLVLIADPLKTQTHLPLILLSFFKKESNIIKLRVGHSYIVACLFQEMEIGMGFVTLYIISNINKEIN